MKNIVLGITITLLALFVLKYTTKKGSHSVVSENSLLIEEQLKNVGKLIVTEGYFSEVFNYENSKALLGEYITSEKKALVVVNAEVTIAYDLSKLTYTVDNALKTIKLTHIPKEEIKIHPDFEYYDVQADFFNPFEAKDYNIIKDKVHALLLKKIEASAIKSNAKERLMSELSKFYIITQSMGWTLQYDNTPITSSKALNSIPLKQ